MDLSLSTFCLPTSLLNSYERTEADYIEKLKSGYHSVLGVGKTQPNPDEAKVTNAARISFFFNLAGV